jgi:hypothetical protein
MKFLKIDWSSKSSASAIARIFIDDKKQTKQAPRSKPGNQPKDFRSFKNSEVFCFAFGLEDSAADVSAWEREIDRLVYALYGLTEEEIAIVEGK